MPDLVYVYVPEGKRGYTMKFSRKAADAYLAANSGSYEVDANGVKVGAKEEPKAEEPLEIEPKAEDQPAEAKMVRPVADKAQPGPVPLSSTSAGRRL